MDAFRMPLLVIQDTKSQTVKISLNGLLTHLLDPIPLTGQGSVGVKVVGGVPLIHGGRTSGSCGPTPTHNVPHPGRRRQCGLQHAGEEQAEWYLRAGGGGVTMAGAKRRAVPPWLTAGHGFGPDLEARLESGILHEALR